MPIKIIKKYGIWALILFFSFVYSLYSVVRHLKFETYIFDLGYYDQLIWQASRGLGLHLSTIEAHAFTDHFSPTILLLSPLYWIWADPIILLLSQSIIICLGAYPIYKLSLTKTRDALFSLTISFAYISFYGIQNAITYDFHALAFSASLLAWVLWFYETKKYKLFWVSLILLVGLQENFFILGAAIGTFIIIKFRDYRRGLIITLTSTLLFLLLIFYIIPTLFGNSYYYLDRRLEDLNLGELTKMLYSPQSKIDVVFFSFLAFGFLPLLSLPSLILAGEEFLGRFLGTTNPNWWILGFHYNAPLAGILTYGAIDTVSKYFKRRLKLVAFLIFAGILLSQIRVKTDIYKMFKKDFYNISNTQNAREVLKLIPDEASVAATNDLGTQIARRKGLIFLTNCIDNPNPIGEDGRRCFNITPDYIVANMDPSSPNNFYPDYNRESIASYLTFLQNSGKYHLIERKGEVYLLKKLK